MVLCSVSRRAVLETVDRTSHGDAVAFGQINNLGRGHTSRTHAPLTLLIKLQLHALDLRHGSPALPTSHPNWSNLTD